MIYYDQIRGIQRRLVGYKDRHWDFEEGRPANNVGGRAEQQRVRTRRCFAAGRPGPGLAGSESPVLASKGFVPSFLATKKVGRANNNNTVTVMLAGL